MKADVPLNFDFGDVPPPDTEVKFTKPEIVNQTPFDQDERFSIVKAEQSFVTIKNKLLTMSARAKLLDVKDDATNTVAMEMLVQCKALVKTADKHRKDIPAYKVASEFKSGVDTFIREQLKKPIEKIEKLINPKVSSYQKAQAELQRRIERKKAIEESERIAIETREAEEKAQIEYDRKVKEAQELQEKLNKDADTAGVERVQVDIPEPEDPEVVIPSCVAPIIKRDEKVTTDQGKATVASKWVCKIITPDKVARVYCEPSQRILDEVVAAGEREIQGCSIEEVFEAKVRMSSKRRQSPFGGEDNNNPL